MKERGGGDRPAAPPRSWLGRVEIPAADPADAARFYAEALGWEARPVEGGDAPYFDLVAPAPPPPPSPTSPASSANPAGPPEPPTGAGVTTAPVLGAAHPLAVIHVDGDLGPVLERVNAAGGRTDLAPTPVPGKGTFARFRDPDGNLLGLWSSDDA